MVLKTIYVTEMQRCDFCPKLAQYDGPTRSGPWGYMCPFHFNEHGMGQGNHLILVERKKRELIQGVPEVNVKYKQDLWGDYDAWVICPVCKQRKNVEVDANYIVTCERCGQRFQCKSMF